MTSPLQLALPFSLREAVSVRRAGVILGVGHDTIYRMMESQAIEHMRRGGAGIYMIRYTSLVEYCDALRKAFGIPDRRPVLSNSIFRHADRDIPPFPLDQNLTTEEVMRALQLEKSRVVKMAEKGLIESYHLTENSPWRFYRPAVQELIEAMHRQAQVRRSIHVRT